MKVIKTSWFPFGRYTTINIFGVLFTKLRRVNATTYNHECIHTAQMKEMLYIFFYIWYGIEYIMVRFFHGKQNRAYHDISLEEEAYNNEYNPRYVNTRRHYAWLKYIKIKSSNVWNR